MDDPHAVTSFLSPEAYEGVIACLIGLCLSLLYNQVAHIKKRAQVKSTSLDKRKANLQSRQGWATLVEGHPAMRRPCEPNISAKAKLTKSQLMNAQTTKTPPLKRVAVPSDNCNPTIFYTGTVCNFDFGPRENHDDDERLFAMPPPPEECPLCCHQMPFGVWEDDEGVSNQISSFRACCGKNICCGCVFAVHHPEFKDLETFTRSIDPLFLKPKNGGATKAAKPNKGRGKKKGRGNNNKKLGKGTAGKGQVSTEEKAKSMTFPYKAEPPSGKTPLSSEGCRGGEGGGQPCHSASERTVQLHLDGTLKWESQNACPFCRSPELKGSDLVAALLKRIDDLNCAQSHFEMGKNYLDGANGCEKSLEKARECWEKSAKLGNMMAHFSLAMYYKDRKGLGYDEDRSGSKLLSKDEELARYHFIEAAVLGHPEARYNVAYYEGKDGHIGRAFAHYQIAAKQGSIKSLKQCEEVYRQGVILSASEYESCVESKESVWKEMCSQERLLAMRYRRLMKMGLLKSDPIGSFTVAMYGRMFKQHGVVFNGKQEFRFNPDKCQYEEVKDKKEFKMVGRLTADGRPLQQPKTGAKNM